MSVSELWLKRNRAVQRVRNFEDGLKRIDSLVDGINAIAEPYDNWFGWDDVANIDLHSITSLVNSIAKQSERMLGELPEIIPQLDEMIGSPNDHGAGNDHHADEVEATGDDNERVKLLERVDKVLEDVDDDFLSAFVDSLERRLGPDGDDDDDNNCDIVDKFGWLNLYGLLSGVHTEIGRVTDCLEAIDKYAEKHEDGHTPVATGREVTTLSMMALDARNNLRAVCDKLQKARTELYELRPSSDDDAREEAERRCIGAIKKTDDDLVCAYAPILEKHSEPDPTDETREVESAGQDRVDATETTHDANKAVAV